VNFEMNSDNFIFDQEIIAQFVDRGLPIAQVPVPTRYFAEASSTSFWQSSVYGMAILRVLAQFWFHGSGIARQRRFDSLASRYGSVPSATPSAG
jgi:hypothetical protein